MIFNLMGDERQNAIVRQAIALCDFPFDALRPELQSEVNRAAIPVEWADLSRYAGAVAQAVQAGGPAHIHENGDTGHPVESPNRKQVLGLAWYSGRISIDRSLVNNPALAREVFLSEVAHMVDFFYMTDADREWLSKQWDPTDKSEWDWFDVGPYETWMGEAFMGLFCAAFAPGVPVTLTQFVHKVTPEMARGTRALLLRQGNGPTDDGVAGPDPLAGFPFEALDAWAASENKWWSRKAKAAARSYREWNFNRLSS